MASLVRYAAVAAAALVAASFLLFAATELRDSSQGQVEGIDGSPASASVETGIQRPNPEPAIERVREANHSDVREWIDDANDVLVAPFTGFTDFESAWGERLAALILGLALWGGIGLLLANFLPKHRNDASDWREATS